MPLQVLKDLLNKNSDNAQTQANLLTLFARLGGRRFNTVAEALAAE